MGEEDSGRKSVKVRNTGPASGKSHSGTTSAKLTTVDSLEPPKKRFWAQPPSSFDYYGWGALAVLACITVATYPYGDNTGRVCAQRVFFFGWVTALSTGLGVVPFIFVRQLSDRWLGLSNAFAAGMMFAATWSLLVEGCQFDEDAIPMDEDVIPTTNEVSPALRVVIGFVLGIAFILATKSFLDSHDNLKFGQLNGASAHKILLFVLVMTLHSISEGVSIGVSFGGRKGFELGHFISMSLAVHNIPEGLAVALVMSESSVNRVRSALWSISTSLPQPIMAVPAFLFVETFIPILPVGLGFAGGAMFWVAARELFPEAVEKVGVRKTALACVGAAAFMLHAQHLLKFL